MSRYVGTCWNSSGSRRVAVVSTQESKASHTGGSRGDRVESQESVGERLMRG